MARCEKGTESDAEMQVHMASELHDRAGNLHSGVRLLLIFVCKFPFEDRLLSQLSAFKYSMLQFLRGVVSMVMDQVQIEHVEGSRECS